MKILVSDILSKQDRDSREGRSDRRRQDQDAEEELLREIKHYDGLIVRSRPR